MARSLAQVLLKGIGSHPITNSNRIASGYFYHNVMGYSTTVPNDPDTHEDFKPAKKQESSSETLLRRVEEDVKNNPVVLYMKGVPEAPQCGFSSLAVRVLKQYKAPLFSRDILKDPDLKIAVKTFSNWPTFPQIFIKGEFIGGSDIILEMHQNGELEDRLRSID